MSWCTSERCVACEPCWCCSPPCCTGFCGSWGTCRGQTCHCCHICRPWLHLPRSAESRWTGGLSAHVHTSLHLWELRKRGLVLNEATKQITVTIFTAKTLQLAAGVKSSLDCIGCVHRLIITEMYTLTCFATDTLCNESLKHHLWWNLHSENNLLIPRYITVTAQCPLLQKSYKEEYDV